MKKKAKIGIIGLGYVGLPLFVEFSKNLKLKVLTYQKKRLNSCIKKKIILISLVKRACKNLKPMLVIIVIY